jgi:guanine deaminase
MMNPKFMEVALKEARQGMEKNEGGPFGAVIVKNNRVMAKAHNQVILSNDPTAHAEILAIRKAAKKLGRFNLSDCEIYSTCEPCPMCLAAIHWAKMKKLYFGCTRRDAAKIGFDDSYIYQVIRGTGAKKQVVRIQMARQECLRLFRIWEKKPDKVRY